MKLSKNILIGLALLVVAVVVVVFVIRSQNNSTSNARTGSSLVSESGVNPIRPPEQNSEVSAFSGELLILLGSLEKIDLNDSILFNPAFRALRDISIPILREGNEGRPNPFSPIGVDNSASVVESTPITVVSSRADTRSQSQTTTEATETTDDANATEQTDTENRESATGAAAEENAPSSNNPAADSFGQQFGS